MKKGSKQWSPEEGVLYRPMRSDSKSLSSDSIGVIINLFQLHDKHPVHCCGVQVEQYFVSANSTKFSLGLLQCTMGRACNWLIILLPTAH